MKKTFKLLTVLGLVGLSAGSVACSDDDDATSNCCNQTLTASVTVTNTYCEDGTFTSTGSSATTDWKGTGITWEDVQNNYCD